MRKSIHPILYGSLIVAASLMGQVLAALNHPNIAGICGVEKVEGAAHDQRSKPPANWSTVSG